MPVGLLLAVALVMGSGCGGSDGDLARLLPAVDGPTLRGLGTAGTPAFDEFAADCSTDRLIALRAAVVEVLFGDPHRTETDRGTLRPVLRGLDEALATTRHLPEYRTDSGFLAGLGAADAAALVTSRERLVAVFADPEMDSDDKIREIETLQADLLAAGDDFGALPGWGYLSILVIRSADRVRSLALQRRAYTDGRRLGCLVETGNAYGQILMHRMHLGWSGAERDTLRDLVVRTHRSRLAGTTAYLLTLQAYDADNRGRHSTSRTLFEDAIAVCREFGEPTRALQPMSTLLRMYADRECWNQVDDLLGRARTLLAESGDDHLPTARERLAAVRFDNLAARVLVGRGRFEEAADAFARVFAAARELPYEEASYIGFLWFETMMDNDQPVLAMRALAAVGPIIDDGILAPLQERKHLWEAWLAWRRGDLPAARSALERFDQEALQSGSKLFADAVAPFMALEARTRQPGDPRDAAAVLGQAWHDLAVRVAGSERGPEAYLDMARSMDLRWAAQDLLAADAATGYGLELLWRAIFLERAPDAEVPADGDLVRAADTRVRRSRERLAAGDAIHCLYQVRRERVIRWTAHGGGVERSVLGVSASELRARVVGALARMARDPGRDDAPPPAELVADLGRLARILLPDDFLDATSRPRTLLVSGEGFLNQIPFSPLDLGGAGEYEPLGRTVDVAWIRLGPGRDRSPGHGASLVVADPAVSAATRRRFALEELPGAELELAAVQARLPGITVLKGKDATREGVRAHWSDASLIYYIGHALVDPDAPFVAWLPLAGVDEPALYPGLDIKDILDAPLNGCDLVVLSGCATGAPYVDGYATAPSLGDAFLDAGANASIQTFWRLRDENMQVKPERILAAWRGGADLVAAVSAERRHAMAGRAGIRHPFTWAAWSVKVRSW